MNFHGYGPRRGAPQTTGIPRPSTVERGIAELLCWKDLGFKECHRCALV